MKNFIGPCVDERIELTKYIMVMLKENGMGYAAGEVRINDKMDFQSFLVLEYSGKMKRVFRKHVRLLNNITYTMTSDSTGTTGM